MPKRTISLLAACVCVLTLFGAAPAHAAVPSWLKPAVDYLVKHDAIERSDFKANATMTRRAFRRIMQRTFGGGYDKTTGRVSTREVDAALVRVLGKAGLARRLNRMRSPDGWNPHVPRHFGTEIVARELGLRYNHLIGTEHLENSVNEKMKQANIVYAVYRAKVGPNTWGADELEGFRLANFTRKQRSVVRFAFQQVGVPYYWSGEWPVKTPAGYPYGAQVHGGFDCSGFAWYVTRRKESIWSPARPYAGWRLDQRSSADIGGGASRRLRYSELKPGDLIVFGSNGRKSSPSSLYHTGVYIGRGWMIDSSGSQAGVSLSRVAPGSWWHDEIAWGRRVIK
jgi:cell wall-associated NlpC family hydrolase